MTLFSRKSFNSFKKANTIPVLFLILMNLILLPILFINSDTESLNKKKHQALVKEFDSWKKNKNQEHSPEYGNIIEKEEKDSELPTQN